MNRWIILGGAAALAMICSFGCNGSSGEGNGAQPDGSAPSATSTSTPPPPTSDGGSIDAGRTSCLDRPNPLSRAPDNRLPCELIPPGLRL